MLWIHRYRIAKIAFDSRTFLIDSKPASVESIEELDSNLNTIARQVYHYFTQDHCCIEPAEPTGFHQVSGWLRDWGISSIETGT